MRFMMIMHPNMDKAYRTEGLTAADLEAVQAMTKFNQSLVDAGALLGADGLHGPAKGARVRFPGGKAVVTDGPFSEAKEVIGGYWIIQAKSKEEAVEWARRIPGAEGDMVEVRQLFDMEDHAPEVQEAGKLQPPRAQG